MYLLLCFIRENNTLLEYLEIWTERLNLSVFRYSYSSTDLKYSWHTHKHKIFILTLGILIWIKINVTKIFFLMSFLYGKIFPFPWMNESHQRVSQLLTALLQFALASFMYIKKKKRSINSFPCSRGPRGLIWSPHRLCGPSSTQTVFTANSLEIKSAASLWFQAWGPL